MTTKKEKDDVKVLENIELLNIRLLKKYLKDNDIKDYIKMQIILKYYTKMMILKRLISIYTSRYKEYRN